MTGKFSNMIEKFIGGESRVVYSRVSTEVVEDISDPDEVQDSTKIYTSVVDLDIKQNCRSSCFSVAVSRVMEVCCISNIFCCSRSSSDLG